MLNPIDLYGLWLVVAALLFAAGLFCIYVGKGMLDRDGD